MKKGLLILMVILSACAPQKETAKADVHLVSANGIGDEIGTVTFTDTDNLDYTYRILEQYGSEALKKARALHTKEGHNEKSYTMFKVWA